MKDSIEQIVARYKADPSSENMRQIAIDNGCTMHEIGQMLKDAAAPKKKSHGRPKKPSSDTTKKNTKEN